MMRMRTPLYRSLWIGAAAAVAALLTTGAAAPDVRKGFADPPSEYRPMPLWVWNDLHEWPRLAEMLAQYKQQGLGGAFVHPRPGLMTEYLGADWFRLWKQSATEGKRLGLLVNIYDENSYPSGFAGGHVPAQAPDTATQFVTADPVAARAVSANPLTIAFFAMTKDGDGYRDPRRVTSPSGVKPGETVIAFRLRRAGGNPWTAEFPYVDLTNPQTAPKFIEATYERYKKEIGAEFGKTVRWAFADEPLLATAGAYDNAGPALPLSRNTLAEFAKRHGYALEDHIASLFWDVGEFRKVRFDYWQTMHDLWLENFIKPLYLWCDRNGLQFTGHWMEHEWPAPWITPDDASLYAYEHVPGIDMLEGTNLRLNGKDPHMLFTIKQVASVSHQLGRRAFCEAYGVAGWDSTFEHYKRFGDWLMVHGINFMDQHLSFTTIRGARKRDHPQSFSDVSPWWPYYRTHADHLARWSYLSSLSAPRHRVVIVQQTTSGFLTARRMGPNPELEAIRARNAEMNQFLADHQVDYDLGDEYMLEWHGKADGKKFRIAKASYDLVVLPPDLANLRSQTVPLLEAWLAGGGEILSLSEPPAYVDGRPSDALKQMQAKHAARWKRVASNEELLAGIRQRMAPRLALDPAPPSGVGFSERWLPSGERVLFFANSGLKPVRATATVPAGSLEVMDTETGRAEPAAYDPAGDGRVKFTLDLAPAGSLILLAKDAPGQPAKPVAQDWKPVETGPWSASPDRDNVLVLDYCDLTTAGETHKDVNTWSANWTIWQRHGFERPAWDNAVQYRTRVFDKNHFGPDSGFTAAFRFRVDEAVAIRGLRLALESPELYKVKVNGKPLAMAKGVRWLDPHLSSFPIETLAQTGENTVEIEGRPFDVKMELENIYLLGRFSVAAAEKGFALKGPGALHLGSWARQGMPFYGDAVTYQTEVASAGRLKVSLGDWQGSVVAILLDGKRAEVRGWPPYEADFPAPAGRHKLAVQVVSTPRNVFGPFHHPAKIRMRAWPAAWAEFPERQPAGSAYDTLDYGLMEAPKVATSAR
jgi:hypothetical protein